MACAKTAHPAGNPAAEYCLSLGYDYFIETTPSGGETGICVMPNGSYYDDWDFVSGNAGLDYGYCSVQGYGARVISDERCGNAQCVVCVLPDGSERESSTLLADEAGGKTAEGAIPTSGGNGLAPYAFAAALALLVLGAFLLYPETKKRQRRLKNR